MNLEPVLCGTLPIASKLIWPRPDVSPNNRVSFVKWKYGTGKVLKPSSLKFYKRRSALD